MNQDLIAIADYLTSHGLTVVTAESITAGLIASKLAELPGAGHWLDCAFVTYSEDAKMACLNVDDNIMQRFGLTSEEVARAMAEGALRIARANLAIATTGIAGPGGDDGQEKVGTVCFAWTFAGKDTPQSFSEKTCFDGGRNEVREKAAMHALGRIAHYHATLAG